MRRPHDFCLVDSPNGRATLEIAGADAELPLLQFPDGSILQNPTNAELALATGGPVCPEQLEFDVVVVGAGRPGCPPWSTGRRKAWEPWWSIGGDRWPGHLELPDPHLLGFPRGLQRPSARPERLPPGVGVRRRLHPHAP